MGGSSDWIMFEMWLEKNRNNVVIFGVILLVFGLILLAVKHLNSFQYVSSNTTNQRQTIPPKGGFMQPGLREDRKITEYERKKRQVSAVLKAIGAVILLIILVIIAMTFASMRINISALLVFFYPVIILIAMEISLYLTNAIICAVFDHVIEMCYANQYRIMRDYPYADKKDVQESFENIETEETNVKDEQEW